MLNRNEIEKRIKHVMEHGDCCKDVHDLAMLMYLRDHMEDEDEYGHKGAQKLTREQAVDWVNGMHGEDPAVPNGGKWTMEQVQPIAIKYGVQPGTEECIELWAVMNALYNDYYGVAKKYNALTPDFFADMAMAFIHDKDARPGKVARYYRYIAKGE